MNKELTISKSFAGEGGGNSIPQSYVINTYIINGTIMPDVIQLQQNVFHSYAKSM